VRAAGFSSFVQLVQNEQVTIWAADDSVETIAELFY
jgi:hypothetical protein